MFRLQKTYAELAKPVQLFFYINIPNSEFCSLIVPSPNNCYPRFKEYEPIYYVKDSIEEKGKLEVFFQPEPLAEEMSEYVLRNLLMRLLFSHVYVKNFSSMKHASISLPEYILTDTCLIHCDGKIFCNIINGYNYQINFPAYERDYKNDFGREFDELTLQAISGAIISSEFQSTTILHAQILLSGCIQGFIFDKGNLFIQETKGLHARMNVQQNHSLEGNRCISF